MGRLDIEGLGPTEPLESIKNKTAFKKCLVFTLTSTFLTMIFLSFFISTSTFNSTDNEYMILVSLEGLAGFEQFF